MSFPPEPPWAPGAFSVLEARTRAVARPPAPPEVHARAEALRLRVAGEPYALPASAVRAVAELTRLTPLPYAPPEVAGLTVRGGGVLPVFHLRAVLGLPLSALPEFGRIVVLGEDQDALALVVDAVEGIVPLAAGVLGEPPPTVGPEARALLLGIGADGVPVLDPDALLASPRLFVEIPLARAERK